MDYHTLSSQKKIKKLSQKDISLWLDPDEMIISHDTVRDLLSVSDCTFDNWTSNKKKQLDEERNQKILDLYLQCHTLEKIETITGISKSTVGRIIDDFSQNSKYTEMGKMFNFKPNPHNIWSYSKQGDTDTTVFGTALFVEIFNFIGPYIINNGLRFSNSKKNFNRLMKSLLLFWEI